MDDGRWTVGDGSESRVRVDGLRLDPRELTKNCGNGTTSLKKYGEYKGLQKALKMQPKAVVEEIKASGLVGRGGAAFPTGIKWEGAMNRSRSKIRHLQRG
jgi:NADH:ubiquinone oxidoreductase subunit F (NADH-binding)